MSCRCHGIGRDHSSRGWFRRAHGGPGSNATMATSNCAALRLRRSVYVGGVQASVSIKLDGDMGSEGTRRRSGNEDGPRSAWRKQDRSRRLTWEWPTGEGSRQSDPHPLPIASSSTHSCVTKIDIAMERHRRSQLVPAAPVDSDRSGGSCGQDSCEARELSVPSGSVETGGRRPSRHQATAPSSLKKPAVAPSAPSASSIAIAAPCSGVRSPRKAFRSVAV